jgi:hypothetical protein
MWEGMSTELAEILCNGGFVLAGGAVKCRESGIHTTLDFISEVFPRIVLPGTKTHGSGA